MTPHYLTYGVALLDCLSHVMSLRSSNAVHVAYAVDWEVAVALAQQSRPVRRKVQQAARGTS